MQRIFKKKMVSPTCHSFLYYSYMVILIPVAIEKSAELLKKIWYSLDIWIPVTSKQMKLIKICACWWGKWAQLIWGNCFCWCQRFTIDMKKLLLDRFSLPLLKYWTCGLGWNGSSFYPSFRPSFHLSISFLWISPLVFSETWSEKCPKNMVSGLFKKIM